MIRRQLKRALALFLSLMMLLTTVPLQTLAADDVTVAKNDYIQVTLNNKNGRFSIRTVDGQPVRKLDQDAPLTFDRDDTSFTTFRINGTEYIFGNRYSIDSKKVRSTMSRPQLHVSDDTGTEVISTTWSVEGVDITQELTVFGNTKKTDTTLSGMVMLSYTVNNQSGAEVRLGSRVLLDTMIGINDGPSYQNGTISANTQTTERTLVRDLKKGAVVDGQEITEDNINYYDLQAFYLMRDAGGYDDPLATNIFAYGYHNFTDSLNLVDRVVVGHWNHLANSKYEVEVDPNLDFTVDTNDYGTADSAVAYFWDDKALSNGDSLQYQVLYGLGEIIEENQAFNVTFPSPVDHLLATPDGEDLENHGVFPVTVQVEVPVDSEMYHSSITCNFHLGNNLRFAETENGEVVLDGNGEPVPTGTNNAVSTTAKEMTPEEIQKREEEINTAGSSHIGMFGPGDMATFQYYIIATARPWPTIRSYYAEVTSPQIEDAMGQIDYEEDPSSAELVNAMDGDPALAAMMSVVRSASILIPAVGEMTQSSAFSLTPEMAYYKDDKIVTVGMTNIDAYDNADRETYQVYLVNAVTGDKYQVPKGDISKTTLDGKTGLMNFTYRGAASFNNNPPGDLAKTPELPAGAYNVQVVYSGSADKEVNEMLSFTSSQVITVTTNREDMIRTGSIVTIAKRYVEADQNYKDFIKDFNQAAQETADLKRYEKTDAYKNGNSVYEALKAGYTYNGICAPSSDDTDTGDDKKIPESYTPKYRPYYEIQLWNREDELEAYKREINAVEDQSKYKGTDVDDNWNHGEILLTIRGRAREQDGDIVIDKTSPDLLINDVVRYGDKQSIAFLNGKRMVRNLGSSDIRIQSSPFMDSVGDKLGDELKKLHGAAGLGWNIDDYQTITVSADGALGIHGENDEQFYAGEWRIDFFEGFDKSLWVSQMDAFKERTAKEMQEKKPTYTVQTHSYGIVADQAIPCGMIWDSDVYFNMMKPTSHIMYCGGGTYDITEFVLTEKNNESLLTMAGTFDLYIARCEAENLSYDQSGFWGQESNINFDAWNLLGLFTAPSDDAAGFISGNKTSSGASPAQYVVRNIGIDTVAKAVLFAADGKVLIQRSKAKTDYYFTAFHLLLKDMFNFKAEVGVKRAKDGKLKPDHILGVLDFQPDGALPWKTYEIPKGATKPSVLGHGIQVGPNTYLTAFRLSISDLADAITHDTSFPVVSAGVNVAIPVDDPTGMTQKLSSKKLINKIVEPGSKLRLLGIVDLTVRSSGFELEGKLKMGAIELINEAYVKVQWVDPWFFSAKVTVDVLNFHVIIGTGSLTIGKQQLEGYLMTGIFIPEAVPVIGGNALAKVEVGFNKEKIWGSVDFLLVLVPICISVAYYFGSGDIDFSFFETESLEDKPDDGNLWYLLYTDEETGEQGMMGIGGNLRYVASSPSTMRDKQDVVYRDLGGGVQFLEFRANEIGPSDITVTEHYNADTDTVDSWTHSIPVGMAKGSAPADALVQVEYFDNSQPDLSVKIGGKTYPIVWGDADSGSAAAEPKADTIYAIKQELPDNGTTQHRAYLAVSYEILKDLSEDAQLELTSDQQIDTALIRCAKTLAMDGVTVETNPTDSNKLTVTTKFRYAKAGDTLALSLSEDSAMPESGGPADEALDPRDMADAGMLIYEDTLTAEEAAAGSATRVIDLTKCSVPVTEDESVEQDVRQMLMSGTYYMRANMRSAQSYQSVISPTPIALLDPMSPAYDAANMNVTLEPAGNGKFAVTFPKVANRTRDGHAIEHMTYGIDFYQDGEEYGAYSGLFFDPDEENPDMTYDAATDTYTVILGARFSTQNTQVDDDGNVIGQTESHVGLDTGKRYQASVRVANAEPIEDSGEPSYHFGMEALSNESFLPEPTPPKLTVSGADHVTEYVNEDGSVDEVDFYELLTNEENPSVTVVSDVDAVVSIATDQGEAIVTDVSLKANTPYTLDLSAYTENGQTCVEITGENVKTKDTDTTTLYLTVDRIPPTLILDGAAEDVYSAFYEDGVMRFSGITSSDTVLRAYAGDSGQAISGEDLFTFEENGMNFTASIPVSRDESQATVRITATDKAGNETAAALTMRNGDYDVVRGIRMQEIPDLVLPLEGSGDVTTELITDLIYHSGTVSELDAADVAYSVYLGSSVALDDDSGMVTAVQEGMSVIKAAYTDANGMEYEDLMTVRVLGETTEAIRVVPPTKAAYALGEELDLTGGQVVIVHNGEDGETIPLTADMVTGFDNTKTGTQTLYVTYGGSQDSFQITMSETAGAWALSALAVKPPVKTRYLTGDTLNLDGAALTMTYRLGGESREETQALEELTDVEITGFDNTKAGSQILTVTYQGQSAQFRVEVVEKKLTSVKVETLPDKTVYLVNKDDLDLTGGQLALFYNEGDDAAETQTLDLTDEGITVTGYDKTKVGSQPLTVSYQDQSDTETLVVVVNDRTLDSIRLKGTPKSEYLEGSPLDVDGVLVTLMYDNGTEEDIPLTEGMISGYDADQPGEQTLTVTYNGKATEYTVTVTARTLTDLELVSGPYKTKYAQDAELNWNGAELHLTYDNGVERTLIPSGGQFGGEVSVTGYDATKTGKQTVTLSAGGRSVTVDVEVTEKKLLSAAMEKLPTKLTYKSGEALDLTGGRISLYYDNGTTETTALTESMVSGYNAAKTGVQTLTVTYGNSSVTFNVTVSEKVLSGIRLSKDPDKLEYLLGETLDVTGGEVTLVYDDGSEEGPIALTEAMVSGFASGSPGTRTLTVTYQGFRTTYTVTVSKADESSAYGLDVQPDGTYTVTVKDDAVPRGILVVAKYGADGRMSAIRSIPIELTPGTHSGVLEEMRDPDANYTVSLLTISYISLCERVEIHNV